ncbi:MAG: hypothetical protein KBC69_00390 [Candidatus Magasanikbacteria bacterium]|nr:hypothetical protein [Candidatus Magasanikbacteria bacterium]
MPNNRSRSFYLTIACLVAACGEVHPNIVDGAISDTMIDTTPDAPPLACECPDPALERGTIFAVCPENSVRYSLNTSYRLVRFPDESVFQSWRTSDVVLPTMNQDCTDGIAVPSQYPSQVNYRPGSYVVSRGSNLYVVLPHNTLAPITAQVAATLYVPAEVGGVGSNPIEIADALWPNYTGRANPITEVGAHPGMLFATASGLIYYVDINRFTGDMWKRLVTPTGFEANSFQHQFVRREPPNAANIFTGPEIESYDRLISDPTQTSQPGS